jgi:hypothetical protein
MISVDDIYVKCSDFLNKNPGVVLSTFQDLSYTKSIGEFKPFISTVYTSNLEELIIDTLDSYMINEFGISFYESLLVKGFVHKKHQFIPSTYFVFPENNYTIFKMESFSPKDILLNILIDNPTLDFFDVYQRGIIPDNMSNLINTYLGKSLSIGSDRDLLKSRCLIFSDSWIYVKAKEYMAQKV